MKWGIRFKNLESLGFAVIVSGVFSGVNAQELLV